MFDDYKRSARRRGLMFALSMEQFQELCLGSCHYCGNTPSYMPRTGNRNKYVKPKFLINGIDRKDSGNGYELTNCVACCRICNFMKKAMPYQDFISHITRIYKNRQRQQRKNNSGNGQPNVQDNLFHWNMDDEIVI
jgi:hypothetical protein